MQSVKVYLNTIEKVKEFIQTISGFDCDFDLVVGRYVVDAKSIMGIFSIDVSKPIRLDVHNDTEEIMAALQPFIAAGKEVPET